jgi:hypothetical protein
MPVAHQTAPANKKSLARTSSLIKVSITQIIGILLTFQIHGIWEYHWEFQCACRKCIGKRGDLKGRYSRSIGQKNHGENFILLKRKCPYVVYVKGISIAQVPSSTKSHATTSSRSRSPDHQSSTQLFNRRFCYHCCCWLCWLLLC